MRILKLSRLSFLIACLMLVSNAACADWTTQVFNLRPGWNAVFLEVEPDSNGCDEVFDGLPIRSVWTWNPRFSSAQYVRDPSELLPELPEWLTYFPSNSPKAFLNDLHSVLGGHCYLIEVGGEENVPLAVSGNRSNRSLKWMPDSFNLVGFHIDPNALPRVSRFFSSSEAHSGQPVYRLTEAGKWEDITRNSTARLRPGEAYWVYCDGQSSYSGPLGVSIEGGDVIDFGHLGTEHAILLNNASDQTKTIRMRLRSSERPSTRPRNARLPSYGGDVALAYYNLRPQDLDRKQLSWAPVTDATSFILGPHSELEVLFVVRRSEMPAPRSSEDVYESVLEISDGGGSLYSIPVLARKSLGGNGLWVGTVSVTAVSEAGNPGDSVTPTPTASPFKFRIIVHRDSDGNATLLHHVLLLQLSPKYEPDPDNPDGPSVLVTPSRTVLLARDGLLPQYAGDATVDGKLNGRRISAPIFNFPAPLRAEDSGDPAEQLQWTITMPFTDPMNPMVHRYHPDHDNLDDRYEIALAEGRESFTITRTVTLDFNLDELIEDIDSNQSVDPEIGGNVEIGTYLETIEGVHKNAIHVQGIFILHLVSLVDQLDDGA